MDSNALTAHAVPTAPFPEGALDDSWFRTGARPTYWLASPSRFPSSIPPRLRGSVPPIGDPVADAWFR